MLLSRACADSTLVFNEIMYHPATSETALEWIELHNQMGVNMDISGWSLAGGVQFKFTEGTVVPGRGYIVVAIPGRPCNRERLLERVRPIPGPALQLR